MIDPHRLKTRVQELAERDPRRLLFGSCLHKYDFGPCLSESELTALESVYSIEIPSEYRDFLVTVGNGGAGPGYGLQPLVPPVAPLPPSQKKMGVVLKDVAGNVLHRTEIDDVAANYDPCGPMSTSSASRPFPLTAPFRSISDEMWAAGIRRMHGQLRAEHESNRAAFSAIPFGDGVLKIADYGSGIYAVLVLLGPFRGQVWVTDPHIGDYVPASMRTDLHDPSLKTENAYGLHTNAFSFLDWYEHWLQAADGELARTQELPKPPLSADIIKMIRRIQGGHTL